MGLRGRYVDYTSTAIERFSTQAKVRITFEVLKGAIKSSRRRQKVRESALPKVKCSLRASGITLDAQALNCGGGNHREKSGVRRYSVIETFFPILEMRVESRRCDYSLHIDISIKCDLVLCTLREQPSSER